MNFSKIAIISHILFLTLITSINAPAQIVNIENFRKSPSDTTRFKGNLQSSFYYKNANSVFYSFNNRCFLYYRKHANMFLMTCDYGITRAAGEDFENQAFAHLRYNRTLTHWLKGELFTQLQQNKVLNVKMRYLAGAGPRLEILKGKDLNLFLGALYMYEYEVPINEHSRWTKNRMSNYLSFMFNINEFVHLSGTTYYQPDFAYLYDYRVSGQYRLLVTLTKKFSLKTETNIMYDSQPVSGTINSYSDIMFGVQYDF